MAKRNTSSSDNAPFRQRKKNTPPPSPSNNAGEELDQLYSLLDSCLLRDRPALLRRLHKMRRRLAKNQPIDKGLASCTKDIEKSTGLYAERTKRLPVLSYPEDLPVSDRREEIIAAIREHPVIIVAGETGSGKTTQLPKLCLECGRGIAGMIGITQPRRLAAVSVANRVAEELNESLGQTVGYQIRFGMEVGKHTLVKFMTDGILLAETQGDRDLMAYDTLIIDEAHERNLNVDFLLGYLHQLRARRPDLKIIISSATMDIERFSSFFDDAPIVQVSGRTYPVAVRYHPPKEEDWELSHQITLAVESILTRQILQPLRSDDHENDVEDKESMDSGNELSLSSGASIVDEDTAAIQALRHHGKGHILVFLSGERPIREALDALTRRSFPNVEVLPLFARLSTAEQRRVFQPTDKWRIILTTNVAETSLTIPGVRYVIDSGVARINRYNYRTQVSRLQEERVSQASANQRKGRCGRQAPGLCVRLYSPEDFTERPDFTDPEIRRTSLASVILRMKSVQLGDVEAFPFLDPPRARMVQEGYAVLEELGALDEQRTLTSTGQQLASLPVDPRIGRMILAADTEHALREVLIIASVLSVRDPRERPLDRQAEADAAHKEFFHEKSDFIGWLHVWEFFQNARRDAPSKSQLRKRCKERFLHYLRMREWRDIHHQLTEQAHAIGLKRNREAASYESIHRALLAGLLGRVGLWEKPAEGKARTETGDYCGARGIRFVLWPGSTLSGRTPRSIMAAELVETSRLFGRTLAEVDPRWVEDVAGDLVKRTYRDPYWDGRTGFVRAYEQVTLFGLTLIDKRRKHYGPIDPTASREIFIRDGLVRGDMRSKAPFFRHNQELLADLRDMENRLRRHDLVVDERYLCHFYNSRLPKDVFTLRAFDRWRRKAEKNQPDLLFMTRGELLLRDPDAETDQQFPSTLQIGDMDFPLTYVFDHSDPQDGVTVTLPVEVLYHLEGWCFDWLVPGLLTEKLTYLLKSLPKSLRRNFVPIPDTVSTLFEKLRPDQNGPLLPPLARHLWKLGGEKITEETLRQLDLPHYLRMNIRAVDNNGNELCHGRDIDALRAELRNEMRESFHEIPKSQYERTGITSWTFGELPERVQIGREDALVWAFPGLVDEESSVSLRLFNTPEEAARRGRRGMWRLMILAMGQQSKLLRKGLPISQTMELQYAAFGGSGARLRDEILIAALEKVFLEGQPLPRSQQEFDERLDSNRTEYGRVAHLLCKRMETVLQLAQKAAASLGDPQTPWEEASFHDMFEQLSHLVFPGFLLVTPVEQFDEFPRYLNGLHLRCSRLHHAPSKDRQRMDQFSPYWQKYLEGTQEVELYSQAAEELKRYRWMLEEWRVSLFAQELGTSEKVSPKRLDNQWALIKKAMHQK